MTHDELLTKIEGLWHDSFKAPGYQALLAVVELHKPMRHWTGETVCECDRYDEYSMGYPCETIEAIEKELG